MEDRIAHYMVTFPAGQWPEAYRRAIEVEELPQKGSRRMAAAVTAAAARLGYKERNFFKIIRAYGDAQQLDKQVLGTHRGPRLSTETSAALEDTITRAASGARPAEIQAAVEALCAKRKIAAPSRRAVRTKLNLPAATDLAAYTGNAADFSIDMSPLDLAVEGTDGIPYRAVLTAFINIDSGNALSHVVTAGQPNADDLGQLITEAGDKAQLGSASRASLVAYRSAPIDGPRTKALLRTFGIAVPDIREDSRRPGLTLTGMFGTKLGRVALNPRCDPSAPFAIRETLPVSVVRPAVALLVERYNAGLQTYRENDAAVAATEAIQAITKGPVKSTAAEIAYTSLAQLSR